MEKDKQWVKFFEDNVRYSDVINGIGCNGEQVIRPDDLTELDTKMNGKYRDMLRKAAFGVGFAIIGIENQETVDYSHSKIGGGLSDSYRGYTQNQRYICF